MAACIGERIEDFKVGNLLGKGSFAGVYRAESIHTGLEVAIKMIRKPCTKLEWYRESKMR